MTYWLGWIFWFDIGFVGFFATLAHGSSGILWFDIHSAGLTTMPLSSVGLVWLLWSDIGCVMLATLAHTSGMLWSDFGSVGLVSPVCFGRLLANSCLSLCV